MLSDEGAVEEPRRQLTWRVTGWWVRRRRDERVERVFARRLPQRMLMRRLASSFSPAHARSFEGEIGFSLVAAHRDEPTEWTVAVDRDGGRARREPPERPALRIQARVADLVRVLVGQMTTQEALLGGRATVSGRLLLASRLDEMFRVPSPPEGATAR